MTQPPVPVDPFDRPSATPTSVTVICIIGIVYAVLALLCHVWAAVGSSVMSQMPAPTTAPAGPTTNPFAAMYVKQDPFLVKWQIGFAVCGFALALILLGGSIGGLYLKSAARRALIFYALLALVFVTVRMFITLTVLMPRMQQIQMAAARPPFTPATMKTMTQVTTVLTWLITSALPIAILVVLTRPRVRRAFESTP